MNGKQITIEFLDLMSIFCGSPPVRLIEGSLEVKLHTIWTDAKHSQEEAEPGRNSDVEKVRREKLRDGESQKGEDAGAQKAGKSRNLCFSNVLWLWRVEK